MLEFGLYSRAGKTLFVSSLLASNIVKPFMNFKKKHLDGLFFFFGQEEQKPLAVSYSSIRVLVLLY